MRGETFFCDSPFNHLIIFSAIAAAVANLLPIQCDLGLQFLVELEIVSLPTVPKDLASDSSAHLIALQITSPVWMQSGALAHKGKVEVCSISRIMLPTSSSADVWVHLLLTCGRN